MKRVSRHIMTALLLLVALPVMGKDPGLKIFHYESSGVDCYRMEFSGRKPVEEVVIGATWDGHPISDEMNVEVVKKPSGWKARIEEKVRYGYQYIVLNAPEPTSYKDVPRGDLGRICVRFAGGLKEAPVLPYKFSLRDQSSYIISTVTPGSAGSNREIEKLVGDGVADKLDKAKEAKKKLDKLKDLDDIF